MNKLTRPRNTRKYAIEHPSKIRQSLIALANMTPETKLPFEKNWDSWTINDLMAQIRTNIETARHKLGLPDAKE